MLPPILSLINADHTLSPDFNIILPPTHRYLHVVTSFRVCECLCRILISPMRATYSSYFITLGSITIIQSVILKLYEKCIFAYIQWDSGSQHWKIFAAEVFLNHSGFLDHIQLTHTVGLLWTSDQHSAEASTYTVQHNIETQETNINAHSGIRTRDFSNQAAVDLSLRSRGHQDRPCKIFKALKVFKNNP
jgi:hypothetical protein